MINDKDVHIQVYSVLNADADRVLHSSSWSHNDEELGAGGEKNFVELLKYLGYTVYNEEVY
jgi:hypothetical protein